MITNNNPQVASSSGDSANLSSSLLTEKTFDETIEDQMNEWKCLVCNFVYEGVVVKSECPKCGNNDPDKFD